MDAATREFVRRRAANYCEYCRIPDHALDLPFHIEHIVASVHRIDDSESNLAWACPRCNLRKGTNLTTIDIDSGQQVAMFDPRRMEWSAHFSVKDGLIVGQTPIGRGTVRLLDMNNPHRVDHRKVLIQHGEFKAR
jgi:hypothetical protein